MPLTNRLMAIAINLNNVQLKKTMYILTIKKTTETLITTRIQDNQHNLKSGVAFMAKSNKNLVKIQLKM